MATVLPRALLAAAPTRACAALLAVALSVPTVTIARPARAAPAAGSKAAANDPQLAEARDLYEQGKAAYETFDYPGAVDLWTRAYAKLPDDAAGVRNAMVYNIAGAQEKAFEVSNDIQHLRQAALLLESYVTNYKAMYKRTPETDAEVTKALARIAGLHTRIESLEQGEGPADTAAPTGPGDASLGGQHVMWSTGHSPPPAVVEDNRRRLAAERKTEGLIAGGWTALGLGGLFLLIGVAAAASSPRVTEARAQDVLVGGIGVATIGIGGVVTGGVLLGIGYKRKKRAAATQARFMVTPSLRRDGGGAAFTMQF